MERMKEKCTWWYKAGGLTLGDYITMFGIPLPPTACGAVPVMTFSDPILVCLFLGHTKNGVFRKLNLLMTFARLFHHQDV